MGFMVSLVGSFLLAPGPPAGEELPETLLYSFDEGKLPDTLVQNHVSVQLLPQGAGNVLEVHFQRTDWPNVFFRPRQGTWDWSAHAGLAVDLYNPEANPIQVCVRIDNEGADGLRNCNTGSTSVPPGRWMTFRQYFHTGEPHPFWGMRGLPRRGPVPSGPTIDPTRITAFQIFLPRPAREHTLRIGPIRLFGTGGDLSRLVPLPFVDAFGQYRHADWPGKLHEEKELTERRIAEEQALRAAPGWPGRDRFGGWADGPRREATGWFRTEKIDGRWWLVTPDGTLFFSLGLDCVGTWERTFIEKRQEWFAWLPEPDGPFAPFFGYAKGAHSMAEPIHGEGRTFSFYGANLIRKYGPEWATRWRETTYARLLAWGFNTIANWSQGDVLEHSPLPFVASGSVQGDFRRIEGAGGYWAPMVDVYDPKFAQAAERCLEGVTRQFGSNPLCLGYFVDNEMAWEAIERGTLNSPPDQPCRQAFVAILQEKYGTLERLNQAWGTSAESWEGLRVPADPSAACRRDLDEFVYAFARRYFETVRAALRRHAPHQLYLGCRFASRPPQVVRACADVADVVSFNLYTHEINAADWTGPNDLGKPILIGEFHFGALDRGMFHPGLVATANQPERAAAYARYVRSVADCPSFVGCHWFQYIDEPLTGRWFDGENYNIGFVDVTDTPYPELVEAAKQVHGEVYRRHGEAVARP